MSFNIANPATIDLLLSRRSEKSRRMVAPGPNKDELQKILACGMRVPDHGKLNPWRFLVFEGPSQAALAEVIEKAYIAEGGEISSPKHESLKLFAQQAPILIVVASTPVDHPKIPIWEQQLSAGAACQNILVATHALGYVGNWLTGDSAYSPAVKKYLGLSASDQIAGFIFLGSSECELSERPRPDFNDIVKHW